MLKIRLNGDTVFFSVNRTGHHNDYINFLINYLKLSKYDIIYSFLKKCKKLLSSNLTIFMLDIDKTDLLLFPLIILSSIMKNNITIYTISVRSDEFINLERNLSDFLFNRGRYKFVKLKLKSFLFYILKNMNNISMLSIHNESNNKNLLSKYYNHFISDFQYYDLPYMNITLKNISEIPLKDIKNRILIFTGSNLKRRKIDTIINKLNKVSDNNNNKYLFVGDFNLPKMNNDNVLHLRRYVDNDELIYLIKNCLILYCYYDNNAPSGFFGRGIQLKKTIIVKKNSYLSNVDYSRLIKISKIDEMIENRISKNKNKINKLKFVKLKVS